MSDKKTHWKKFHNLQYLGAYSLEFGKDLIATIKSVQKEEVKNERGTEECVVARFAEKDIKPMILNSTNSKIIQKLYKSPYVEDWAGRKIQIYIANIKAFGEVVEALRIREYAPKQEVRSDLKCKCSDCNSEILAVGTVAANVVANHTYTTYGRELCSDCATIEKNKKQGE